MHFVIPRTYESIVPDYLPAHRALVYASGVAEIAGGGGPACADSALEQLVEHRDPDRGVPRQRPHGAASRPLPDGSGRAPGADRAAAAAGAAGGVGARRR